MARHGVLVAPVLAALFWALGSGAAESEYSGLDFYPVKVLTGVQALDTAQFRQLVRESRDNKMATTFHVVKFYSSKGDGSDPYFKRAALLRPTLVSAAKALRSTAVTVSAIDWEKGDNYEVFREEGIRGRDSLPVLKIFSPDGTSEVYTGDPKQLDAYVRGKVWSFVDSRRGALFPVVSPKRKRAFAEFLEPTDRDRVVLVLGDRGAGSAVRAERARARRAVAALALAFNGTLGFAQTRSRRVAEALGGAARFPAVFIVPADAPLGKARAFEGNLGFQPLRAWLYQWAPFDRVSTVPPKPVDIIMRLIKVGEPCMRRVCVGRGGICIMILMPGELPFGERMFHLESMRLVKRAVAERIGVVAAKKVHYVWTDSDMYSSWVESVFGLPQADYVRTLLWFPQKGRWAPYVRPFRPADIVNWVVDAVEARVAVESVLANPLPPFIADAEEDRPERDSCAWLEKTRPLPDEILSDSFTDRATALLARSPGVRAEEEDEDGGESKPGLAYRNNRVPRPRRGRAGRSVQLSEAVFKQNVVDSPSHWLVWFQSPSSPPSDAEVAAWEGAARALQSMVRFASVPGSERREQILGTLGLRVEDRENSCVRVFPARTLWGDDVFKASASYEAKGLAFTAEALEEYALGLLSRAEDDLVFRVDESRRGSSFQSWFGQLPMQPVLVLYPSRDLDEPPFLLRALAIEFGHLLKMGLAKRSDAEATGVMATAFPAVRLIAPLAKEPNAEGNVPYSEDFVYGPLHFNRLANYIESLIRLVNRGAPARAHDDL